MKKSLYILGVCGLIIGASSIQGATMTPKPSTSPAAKPATTTLSTQELQFANQLSPYHKQIFSTIFTPQMRSETISMMQEYQDTMDEETPMTPDMCVEQTLMNHRTPAVGS